MKIARALEIIRALSDGVDPYTGEVFAGDSPYQRAEIVRALFVAVNALESAQERERRKKVLPERAGEPWDEEEDGALIKRFEEGTSVKNIAGEHKRTVGAIESRLAKLNKIGRLAE
jgi:hypothetical protein